MHVDTVLERFFALARSRASRWGSGYLNLWQILEANSRGGKRFRPLMVLVAYETHGGEDSEAAAYLGAAFELLHTALIVHDDVIDRDFVRRGTPNVSGRYRDEATTVGLPASLAEHRGTSAAVIAGDLALAGAHRLVEGVGASDRVRGRLLTLLDEAIFASAAGELADMDFSLMPGTPTVDEVLEMERLKTAVYSFETPLQAGAILAGADDAAVEALGEFGRCIGIAYQIIDDLLGVFGSEGQTGKTTLGDLREGKRTVLIAHAAGTGCWREIEDLIGDEQLGVETAERVRRILEDCGARGYAESLANDFADLAWTALDTSAVTEEFRTEVRPLVANVVGRTR
ncbi:geranylgeranyl pyrophosphate synthase [Rathayibacter toxicus]|uniref:Geranylgeranyl pyrophosphate synthase n=1 Tax=Rathayibacter toxicus TaxID=145458 RepID=A0A0C5BUE6_9MICO|nr:geranylgeranyl pyrophosphate synthase [Rathayibacter toxicus]ALS57131.1 geranylgeranyl pyrophosphate synthase [Rathayibacter toxicus]KKM46059.1 geranylgeranyl pyrophosphate synthase [Rathayibacter toxicus]PPG23397.1 geranylgeranyl pyrophosphate synthase [Rathayibacter toxicus]PPG47983.1 geranylgeranyl pyrophosphate synthase [Rathayibacter toxicus]